MVKISELIKDLEYIKRTTGDLPIIMSKDGEGNSCSPLNAVEFGFYFAESTWSGEFYENRDEFDGDDVIPVVCLWPVN